MGRLWEGRISKERGYILGGRSRFWEGRIDMVASHRSIIVEKGGISRKEWVDYGNVAYSYQKRGYLFWEEGVDSWRVAYLFNGGGGVYSGREERS